MAYNQVIMVGDKYILTSNPDGRTYTQRRIFVASFEAHGIVHKKLKGSLLFDQLSLIKANTPLLRIRIFPLLKDMYNEATLPFTKKLCSIL